MIIAFHSPIPFFMPIVPSSLPGLKNWFSHHRVSQLALGMRTDDCRWGGRNHGGRKSRHFVQRAKASSCPKATVTSNSLWFLEPYRNKGTIKNSMSSWIHIWLKYATFSIKAKQDQNIQDTERPLLLPMSDRICFPSKCSFIFKIKPVEINGQIIRLCMEKVNHSISDLVLNWNIAFL